MIYTLYTSSCRCVGCPHSPRSLTYVSSRGFIRLPRYKALMSLALKGQRVALFKTQNVLSCNSNYFG
ncbi:hypothetical protein DYD83_18190 [Dickeya fangzhongdai]|uniref:Uncharacterized protein n=1 Tax=Dickeya fangzhongdai TaxID=1778540 RepID=A0A2K8QQF5_9GAMM|nr:hypothetical protein CVE23_18115 [Dickeya fangzhongdai]QOH49159.1 hypothetical protein DYD82_18190 [Dickeya fangzhongdai]QOH53462.1 hypothetical protein DYD83_18190 [Dickeya fangzhongdai]